MTIGNKRWFLKIGIPSLILTAIVSCVFYVPAILSDPSVALLVPSGGAEWIRFDEPVILNGRGEGVTYTTFRRQFDLKEAPNSAVLTVKAMKAFKVFLDGQSVLASERDINEWKTPLQVDLAPMLSPGHHVLRITVLNKNGPAVVLAYCKSLGIFTGEGWEASKDALNWTPAHSVDKPRPHALSRMFIRTDKVILYQLPLLLLIFLIVFFWTLGLYRPSDQPSRLERLTPSVSMVRWSLLALWVLLAVNNFKKVPLHVGFDIDGHLAYIQYIADAKRLPFATEGWEMFQSPFYYIISAPLYFFSSQFFTMETVIRILRVIPLICGIAQVEISYRALKYVFPERKDLQMLGILIGGFLPMNIYISQSIGNEPLAGVLSSLAIILTFGILRTPSISWPIRKMTLIGGFLGLAILTKVTAILLVPAVVFFLACPLFDRGVPFLRIASVIALVIGIVFVISGWYFIRNWIELGKPFIGGWDPSRGIVWWQDPGYRTIKQFLVFGEALFYPVFSTVNGFWDAIYSTFWMDGSLSSVRSLEERPPWNYGFMLPGAWLAILPSIGIILGIVRALYHPAKALRQGELFAVGCIAIYFSALFILYLKVPIYSTAKATYTVGLLPCYAVLAAKGLDIFIHHPFMRAGVYGGIACWAFYAYFAYFVF